MAFVDHVETLGERLKSELESMGEDTSSWRMPEKYKDGICEGIYAKLKSNVVRDMIITEPNHLKCVLKLICVYANDMLSGASFELTATYPENL